LNADVNDDGVVNVLDIFGVAIAWNTRPGDPEWNPRLDLNGDNIVNIIDIITVTLDFGKSWVTFDFDNVLDTNVWSISSGTWRTQNGSLEDFGYGQSLICARNTTWRDCTVSARIKILNDSPAAEAALCVCFANPGDLYWAGLGCWGHRVSISRIVNNVPQELTYRGDGTEVAKDVWYILSIKVSGNKISLYVNNNLELTTEDSTFATVFIGIRPWNSHTLIDYVTVSGFMSHESIRNKGLHTDGTRVLDSSGNEVYLNSVAVHVSERRDPATFWTIDDVNRIKNAGGNCIELHSELISDWMPERNMMDERYFTEWLDKEVAWCEQLGIYCIINLRDFGSVEDWQRIEEFLPSWLWEGIYPYSYPLTEEQANKVIMDLFDPAVQEQEINRQAWIHAWSYVANRYRNNDYVLFGLLNEPFAQIKIPDEGTAQRLGEAYTALMERAIDGIRRSGAEQLVLVDCPSAYRYGTQSLDNVVRIQGENVVWESHHYVTSRISLEQFKEDVDLSVQKFVYEFQQPLFIGEYGMYSPEKPADWQYVLEQELAYLRSKPVCGRSWYEWSELQGERSAVFDANESEWIVQTVLRK
jgi:hypothetical protein